MNKMLLKRAKKFRMQYICGNLVFTPMHECNTYSVECTEKKFIRLLKEREVEAQKLAEGYTIQYFRIPPLQQNKQGKFAYRKSYFLRKPKVTAQKLKS
jgi:hypothetical protein